MNVVLQSSAREASWWTRWHMHQRKLGNHKDVFLFIPETPATPKKRKSTSLKLSWRETKHFSSYQYILNLIQPGNLFQAILPNWNNARSGKATAGQGFLRGKPAVSYFLWSWLLLVLTQKLLCPGILKMCVVLNFQESGFFIYFV